MSPSYAKRAAMTHRVAIVGAGPSGFYAADGLLRTNPDLHIDVIDRLPTPHGLIRAGVAPDHQGTKAVARQFDRLLARPDVRFAGNIEIGRDLSWDELSAAYDAVIVATGMVIDKKLGVPGEDLAHVWGSWRFVGWLNGHPDFRQGRSEEHTSELQSHLNLVCRLLLEKKKKKKKKNIKKKKKKKK